MARILDIDLDFFVHGAVHFVDLDDLTRLDDHEYAVWALDDALAFLRDQCGLSGPLPGWTVERHGEAFGHWRVGLDRGVLAAPLSITHIDAHADLGLGEPVHLEIMGDLMFMPVEDRGASATRVTDGSYLAFACASGWVSDLTYVYNDFGGKDLHPYHMKGWDPRSAALQMKAVQREHLLSAIRAHEAPIAGVDPEIPFHRMNWRAFEAPEPFDAIVVCRSPNFTPSSADPLYDMICDRFVRPI